MNTYRRIINYARPLSLFAIPYFIVALLAELFGIINIGAVMPLLNLLFNPTEQFSAIADPSWFDSFKASIMIWFNQMRDLQGASNMLFIIAAVAIVATFFSSLFRYLSLRLLEKLKAKVIKNLRVGLFSKIISLDLGYFTNQRKGEIISRATNDIYEVEFSVTNSLSSFLKDPLKIIIYFFFLFSISYQMTLFTLLVIPVAGLGISFLTKKLKKSSNITQESIAKITSTIDETISGIRIIKAFRALKYTNLKFLHQANLYEKRYKHYAYRRELASPFSELLGVTVVMGILMYGGNLVIKGDSAFTADVFIMYILMFTQILQPAKAISTTISSLQRGLTSSRRVLEIIDTEVHILDKQNAINISGLSDAIEYKNVSFKYEKELVLKNINLVINKGETVALVGQSGGGKSTVADLLPRFYDVNEGAILVDGINIKDITMDSLREQIGIVSQESILFNDTVFNNIAFGVENASEENVIKAAKIANAHDFIMNLEDGYQTSVGERGLKLSGGQRQRVSIARSIFKNPPILILDEATSALDTESEKLVQEALDNLMENRTSIVIAHRLSTIQNANKIIVIDKGEIAEEGTHSELIAKNGLYFKLNKMQEL